MPSAQQPAVALKRDRSLADFAYRADLPDGRVVVVVKIWVNKVDMRRSMIYAGEGWAWTLTDEENQIRISEEVGMTTRKAAYERALRFANENPKGTVRASDYPPEVESI
jgi:hypothetical protein